MDKGERGKTSLKRLPPGDSRAEGGLVSLAKLIAERIREAQDREVSVLSLVHGEEDH